MAYSKAHPPPITIPSSAAALVAQIASSILSFNSFTSVSVAPPTLRLATPPVNLANLSWYFSLSYCEVEMLIEFLISSTLCANASLKYLINYYKILFKIYESPFPSMKTVSSLEAIIFLHCPRISKN